MPAGSETAARRSPTSSNTLNWGIVWGANLSVPSSEAWLEFRLKIELERISFQQEILLQPQEIKLVTFTPDEFPKRKMGRVVSDCSTKRVEDKFH